MRTSTSWNVQNTVRGPRVTLLPDFNLKGISTPYTAHRRLQGNNNNNNKATKNVVWCFHTTFWRFQHISSPALAVLSSCSCYLRPSPRACLSLSLSLLHPGGPSRVDRWNKVCEVPTLTRGDVTLKCEVRSATFEVQWLTVDVRSANGYLQTPLPTLPHNHRWIGNQPQRDVVFNVCVFITAGPGTKLCAWGGEGEMGGHVLRETTSRGLCGLGCPSRTSERGGEGDCVKEGGGGEGKCERERALERIRYYNPGH
jgi:hypothetical protein